MKRVCKRKVMIDALTVCFEVENRYLEKSEYAVTVV